MQGDHDVTNYWVDMVAMWHELDILDVVESSTPEEAIRHNKGLSEWVFYFLEGLDPKFHYL